MQLLDRLVNQKMNHPEALCSIVTTVVDHIQLVTPGSSNNDTVELPTIRIFGPLFLKYSSTKLQLDACLYITVFPYFYVRPVAAGPDGGDNDDTDVWNDAGAVERLLPALHREWEERLLLASSTTTNDQTKPKFIRKLSVECGRGFYTYCSGPPAPFVRIEYWNPNHKWRIRHVLKEEYHCYEAHIPYTMQFFKDYNLAGLSHLYLKTAQFRTPLPVGVLQGGVELSPMARATSCTVELDATVNDILNALDIQTTKVSPQIHWRAVPSLQDLWRQEERRMLKLVGQPLEPSNGSQSSADQARRGMQQLLHVTEGLEENFQRAMKEIVQRYERQQPMSPTKSTTTRLTPSDEVALQALEELQQLFPGNDHSQQPLEDSNDAYNDQEENLDPTTLTPYDDSSDEDEPMDEAQLEQTLTMLATQLQVTESSHSTRQQHYPVNHHHHHHHSDDDVSDDDDSTVLESHPEQHVESVQYVDGAVGAKQNEKVVENVDCWQHPSNVTVERRLKPPPRSELRVATVLHPIDRLRQQPLWLTFASAYQSVNQGDWFPTCKEGVRVQLCRPAPTRRIVASWQKRREKRAPVASTIETKEKRVLQCNNTIVEEVDWQSSQFVPMSMEHQSQDELLKVQEENKKLSQQSSSTPNDLSEQEHRVAPTLASSTPDPSLIESQSQANPLGGVGNQGGRLWVEGGGQLKAKTRQSQPNGNEILSDNRTIEYSIAFLPTPVTIMSIEIHVQCRIGRTGGSCSKQIALTPVPDRDKVFSVLYVHAVDPGGGANIELLERGCLFVPLESEIHSRDSNSSERLVSLAESIRSSMPRYVMQRECSLAVECVRDEKHLLLRLASIVRLKNPDMLVSWDTQSAGIGYLVERASAIASRDGDQEVAIDLARLLGRTPSVSSIKSSATSELGAAFNEIKSDKDSVLWKGSGLGTEWDERVGAGAAAASIVGRLVFAGWKLVAEEVKHANASYLQAVVANVLGCRIPFHDNIKLTGWYADDQGRERWRVFHHRLTEATAVLLLFDTLDMLGRAGEAARLSGVEFAQSFPGIRGSQYKVEGVILRALKSLSSNERGSKQGPGQIATNSSSLSADCKSQTQSPWKVTRHQLGEQDDHCYDENADLASQQYFFYSPSFRDTNRQEALEVQALTLEPSSGHYQDPVVVCDFTALYPSLIIAYNLCYSTVCGRLSYHSTRKEMRLEGRTTEKVGPFRYAEAKTAEVLRQHLKSLSGTSGRKDRAYVSPTGAIYVAESIVKGVLPQILDEMLTTRAMLKKAAKTYERLVADLSPAILRQLEARQLALKYVANVTYGYTSATFSGRCAMPLLADTIVECGRRTLTRAINLANGWGKDCGSRWAGCKVIYGDTDSVFVLLPGRSVQEAFLFGEEFCAAVTASNPPPVQLKLEKVYLGCIMQTKKKYCGMKFESKDQMKATFEAKGIETVRRDQCALTQKILKNSLITLFQSGPVAVRAYLYRQWALILSGGLPVSDFILTGRVRSRYRGGRVGPVQASLARRLAEADPGFVVRHKQRLSYVIVATPGAVFRLRDCVLTPMELLEQWDAYTIHSVYYITKHVNAALQRCLGLEPHKIDVSTWFESCPKPRKRMHYWPVTRSGASTMISSFFGSDTCSLCGSKCRVQGRSRASVCTACTSNKTRSIETAMQRLRDVQNKAREVSKCCQRCNLCFEDGSTFAVSRQPELVRSLSVGAGTEGGVVLPLANCSCTDCPNTFERHRLRESELEAISICTALNIL